MKSLQSHIIILNGNIFGIKVHLLKQKQTKTISNSIKSNEPKRIVEISKMQISDVTTKHLCYENILSCMMMILKELSNTWA